MTWTQELGEAPSSSSSCLPSSGRRDSDAQRGAGDRRRRARSPRPLSACGVRGRRERRRLRRAGARRRRPRRTPPDEPRPGRSPGDRHPLRARPARRRLRGDVRRRRPARRRRRGRDGARRRGARRAGGARLPLPPDRPERRPDGAAAAAAGGRPLHAGYDGPAGDRRPQRPARDPARRGTPSSSCACTAWRTPARSSSQVARGGWSYREHPVSITYTDYSQAKGQRGYNALNIVFDVMFDRLRAAS